MVYSEEDVPFKFAVHLVNVECRDTRRTPSENQLLYSSIPTKVRKYSATKEEEWSPIIQTVKGDVPICQVNGWPRCFVRPIFRICPTFKCITSRSLWPCQRSVSTASTAVTHGQHTEVLCHRETQLDCALSVTRVHITSWDNSETTPQLWLT